MQPFARGTKGIGLASVLLESDTVSCFSISIAEVGVSETSYVSTRDHLTVTKLIENDCYLLAVLFGKNIVE
jgi:hypothetical protein